MTERSAEAQEREEFDLEAYRAGCDPKHDYGDEGQQWCGHGNKAAVCDAHCDYRREARGEHD